MKPKLKEHLFAKLVNELTLTARMLVREWHYSDAFMESAPLLTQEQADEVANDNVYYMIW